jgi:DMSO/TMAO reductase YedYZ molybdopterin-dependent catalytic subunit
MENPARSLGTMSALANSDVSPLPEPDQERHAATSCAGGFLIRPPRKPHLLATETTPEEELFLAIHMGVVDVDKSQWLLVIDGLVRRPFALTYQQLLKLPSSQINAFHECFGSPLTAPTTALWRVGNVTWTGVRLHTLLALAEPLSSAKFVWSEGLDSGVFADVYADRYQKDLPISKALGPEVLVAYAMNGLPLSPERGGPVRLVVPGWFGTNSTKWLSKLTLSEQRASGPYTTTFYNIEDPDSETGKKPVWQVEVNSMIVKPIPDAVIDGSEVEVEGRRGEKHTCVQG